MALDSPQITSFFESTLRSSEKLYYGDDRHETNLPFAQNSLKFICLSLSSEAVSMFPYILHHSLCVRMGCFYVCSIAKRLVEVVDNNSQMIKCSAELLC